jgi:NAD(P)-dependent dehydrogenase (short-subunit alcohol dehydrogenase family)
VEVSCRRPIDAVVSAAGLATFASLVQLNDADFQLGVGLKLMGQFNLVRLGFVYVRGQGSFTLESGIVARSPMPGSVAINLADARVEAFVKAAALEAPHRIRVNVFSPT